MKTTTRANATRGTVDNDGADPAKKFKSVASRLYSNHSGNMQLDPTVVRLGRAANHVATQGINGVTGNAPVSTYHPVVKHGVGPITKHPIRQGDQGFKNAPHTQPGKIKPNGSDAALRATGSVTSTAPLQKPGGNALGDKNGASNAQALKLKRMYPSSSRDSSRKL